VPGTARINREQRQGIFELVRNHLAGIGDVAIALEENEDIATAERLAIEFGEDYGLLDDIGWRPDEERDAFELTMPPHDLMEVLRRLQGDATRLLEESPTERRPREEDEATDDRIRVGLATCTRLLNDLDPREGDPRRSASDFVIEEREEERPGDAEL